LGGRTKNREPPHAEVTMRIATIILSILDAIGWGFIAKNTLFSESDPATMGLDVIAGWIVTILFLLTAVPALVLALKRLRPKTALTLALVFPVGIGVLIAAGAIYFTYFL
jgi:hypothetical protein